jgi:PAS domain S-box-containing protein
MAMCILKGKDFVVDIANDKVIEIWGTTAGIIGHPVFEWLPILKGQGFEQMLEQVYATGNRVTVSEMRAELPRNGRQVQVYLNFVYEPMIGNGGNVTGIMAVATDVTEQVIARQKIEQSEKQLRQISNLMPQMVWVTDGSGSHLYFNQQWYDFTGSDFAASRDEGWFHYVHSEDRGQTIAKWRHSLESGNIFENEFRLKNGQSGAYIWVLGRAVPIRNEEGSIYKWFGTCTDIHEYKQQELQKDDFIGIASHELKTPLTSVKASLQLMQRVVKTSSSPDVLRKLVDQSARSLDKLGYLVEDLLNVTKINEGQLFLNKSDVSLPDLIEECSQYVRLDDSHYITITSDLDQKIYCDSHRIEQVLINLINNAIKYAPESKEIAISIKQLAGEAKVAVSDKGPGIPAEKVSKLFNRYYRVDNSGILYSGLGLGLYISSEIIKKHHGRFGVDSALGKGSTFWFTLPLSVQ